MMWAGGTGGMRMAFLLFHPYSRVSNAPLSFDSFFLEQLWFYSPDRRNRHIQSYHLSSQCNPWKAPSGPSKRPKTATTRASSSRVIPSESNTSSEEEYTPDPDEGSQSWQWQWR